MMLPDWRDISDSQRNFLESLAETHLIGKTDEYENKTSAKHAIAIEMFMASRAAIMATLKENENIPST